MLRKVLDLLSYPRAILVTIWAAVHTLVSSAVLISLAVLIRNRKFQDFFIIWLWCRPMLLFSGVKVIVNGTEHIRKSTKGFLLLFNHSSYFDIPVLYAYFPRTFRFGAKIELFKVPFFGKAMEICGVLPIDRRNRSQVMKIYDAAAARVAAGESFALAPEGTRQSEPRLGPFKRGPFEFAINAGMDIVPIVLTGAFNVMPRNTILINAGAWSRTVVMDIFPPISTASYTLENVEQLQNKVREIMTPPSERSLS